MKRRTLITTAAILATAVALAIGWGTTPTAADESWVTTPDGLPLFDLTEVAPGDSGHATLIVTNPRAFGVTLSISIASLRNDDNGCNEPELAAGDTTCGPGGGELQDDLRLTLTDMTTNTLLAANTLAGWVTLEIDDPVALRANETRTFRIGYELPIGSSNLTQSDRVAFEFGLRLDQADGTDVASEAVPATDPLPGTGGDHRALLALGLAFLVAGFGLYRMTAGRRPAG